MTEAEWLICEAPGRMLAEVGKRLSERKLLLFGAAIVRRHPDLLDFYGARQTVEVVERYAEGKASETELVEDLARFPGLLGALPRLDTIVAFVADWLQRLDGRPSVREGERRIQADLLRDIAGNPFRRAVVEPAWLQADGGLAARLARVAAEERGEPHGTFDPARLAVLADALEDAGCADESILAHLHGPGPHVRGCWVLDQCLGHA
jgi:hypothetical protein